MTTHAVSNYLVTFMRMITSAQIRSKPEEYEPFLTHPDTGEQMGAKEFCETFVEVLGKEAGEQNPHHSFLSITTNDSPLPHLLILKTTKLCCGVSSDRPCPVDRHITGAQG
jgi:hypothetical protein